MESVVQKPLQSGIADTFAVCVRKRTLFGLLCFILGVIGGMGATSHSQTRLEASVGACGQIPTVQGHWWSWWGGDFQADAMISDCHQIGVSRLVRKNIGLRASWVNLGRVDLKETAIGGPGVQPHWTAVGSGEAKGLTLGVLAESKGSRWIQSIEGGAFMYRSAWSAIATHNASGVQAYVAPEPKVGTTWYLGAGTAYRFNQKWSATLNARVYGNIKANTVGENGDTIGPQESSALSVLFGVRYDL